MTKFLFVSLLAASLAGFARAEILPAEKLLPDDTLVMMTVPDFPKLRTVLKDSPMGQFWQDPAMKSFRDKFMGKLDSDYLTPLEHDLNIHFADFTDLPQGQLTFAITQNGWQGTEADEPAILLLLDTKDKSSQLKTNLTDLKKKWIDAGKTIKTEKIRDLDFSVVALSGNDLAKALKRKKEAAAAGLPEPLESDETKKAPKKELYIGQAESMLIVGNSPKAIEKILIRMSGGPIKTLGEISSYDSDSAMFHNAPFYGWVNTKALTDAVAHSGSDADATNPLGLSPAKIVAGLGLNSLKSVAFNYTFSDAGASFNVLLAAPEADRAGLIKLLAGEAKDCTPPPFVPATVVKYQRWRLDGQKTYAGLRKIINDIYPAALGVVDLGLNSVEAAAKEKDPAFDLKKNLFGNFGDDFITYQKAPRGESLADISSPPSIFLIASPNAEQLVNALRATLVLVSQQAGAPTDRDFLGHKIYSISVPSGPGGPSRSFNYTWSGGYLAISMDNSMIEEYLRSAETPGKPLRDLPGLSDATQVVSGPGTSLFGFVDAAGSERALFQVLKKDPTSDPLAPLAPLAIAMGMGDIKMSEWVDVSLLPSFDQVAKYFYFSVYGESANADGLTFKFFAPTPPGLKANSGLPGSPSSGNPVTK